MDFVLQKLCIRLKSIKLFVPFILLMTASSIESFFISWGTKVTIKTIKKGFMLCPLCACTTPYELKKAQNYFTMYWSPLFANSEPIMYIECQQCKTTYNPLYFGLNNIDEDQPKNDQQVTDHDALVILTAAIGLVAIGSLAFILFNANS